MIFYSFSSFILFGSFSFFSSFFFCHNLQKAELVRESGFFRVWKTELVVWFGWKAGIFLFWYYSIVQVAQKLWGVPLWKYNELSALPIEFEVLTICQQLNCDGAALWLAMVYQTRCVFHRFMVCGLLLWLWGWLWVAYRAAQFGLSDCSAGLLII